MTRRRRTARPQRNGQTTAGQQENRDSGNAGGRPGTTKSPAPPGAAGRQAYDRGRKRPQEFRRSGQIHSDVQDRIE